ncbi:MAG TPA: 16S rRNA (cytidine(1402)-2'-O)-methyltransferase [Dehalococcoidia bacterium]|nr:16S rRNA (cytidine(1402)-2'-O)-methyltransferase [Dehalococcoidia bacterium]
MATLYVVATPIGNLEDVTLRALRVLREVGLIAAEDTRVARKLLARHGIEARLISFNDHNKSIRLPEIIGRLAETDIALISDAGTPAISDPGVELVAAARAAGHAVVPVPGPSAVVTALSVAGLRARTYRFLGFLPREAGPLRRLFASLASGPDTLVAFEAPGRVKRTLQLLAETLPERRLAVCRELTKLHEEVLVGTAADVLARLHEARGEFVLVIEGARAAKPQPADESAWREELAAMRDVGLTRSQAAALLERRYGVSRRRMYELWLDAGGRPGPRA